VELMELKEKTALSGGGGCARRPRSWPEPDRNRLGQQRDSACGSLTDPRPSALQYDRALSRPSPNSAAAEPGDRSSPQGSTAHALRECSHALLAGLKPVLASCSQVADGGGRWLLMTFRGHLGGTPVMRRPSPARPWSLCVAPLPSGSFTPAWRSRFTIPGQESPLPPRMIRPGRRVWARWPPSSPR
jgi:hypothetical protein